MILINSGSYGQAFRHKGKVIKELFDEEKVDHMNREEAAAKFIAASDFRYKKYIITMSHRNSLLKAEYKYFNKTDKKPQGLYLQLAFIFDDLTRIGINHNDAHDHNIVINGRSFALIDWGNARFKDKSLDSCGTFSEKGGVHDYQTLLKWLTGHWISDSQLGDTCYHTYLKHRKLIKG